MSLRQLKYHEKKLLRKVDFLWQKEDNLREIKIMRRYQIRNREEYIKYQKMSGQILKLAHKLKRLPAEDKFRNQLTERLLNKLYDMGLLHTTHSLAEIEKVTASAFARRRLPVVLVRLKFAENLTQAMTFVEHGHIRIGPEVVTDVAYHVTRTYEDFITWVDDSKIVRHIRKYNDGLDDFDLL